MAIIKCKMCGGDLEINSEQTYGTCDSCGSTMTIPRGSDDRKANLYNRANHFRRLNDFDKALSAYESILNEDNTEAEAHWGVVLSRYGIEYVEDPISHDRKPTCHRVQNDSILRDADYLAALEFAPDGYSRSLYEEEAKKISDIQKGILAISSKEDPFDVFICYKESTDGGSRTKDSTLAQDIYYQLVQEGLKVFFSRITLEDKLGQQYEPYIFSALNSAKVMVVVGTKQEYFNSVWVKNEWSRYLALMKKDRNKLLIPCYKDMDPYDLPEEMSALQSQDMSKIGFIQDLIRGVKKVIEAGKATADPSTQQTAAPSAAAPGVASLLGRADIFLEDGDFKSANEYFDKVLDIDPKCAAAYFGKLIASLSIKSRDGLIQEYIGAFDNTFNSTTVQAQRAPFELSASQQSRIMELKSNNMLRENDFAFFDNLPLTCTAREKMAITAQSDFNENKNITNNANYQKAVRFSSDAIQKSYRAVEASIAAYIGKAISEARAQDEAAIEQVQKNCSVQVEKSIADLYTLIEQRTEQARKDEEDRIAREKQAELDRIATKKRNKRNKKLAAILIPAAALIIAFVIVLTTVIIPSGKYNDAMALMEAGKYDEAIAAFTELENYNDSAAKINEAEEAIRESKYNEAVALLKDGKYDQAVIAYVESGAYQKNAEILDYWRNKNATAVAAGWEHTVGLKENGNVVAVGNPDNNKCDVSGWTDIISVSAGSDASFGLKADGSVIAVGDRVGEDYQSVNGWTDIIDISALVGTVVGLKEDGTVVISDDDEQTQTEISEWTNIIAVSCGSGQVVGLKTDGTVIAYMMGYLGKGECNVGGWTDIVAVSAGGEHTVGLKSDGTAVATEYTGKYYDGQCDVSDWTDIVAISAGFEHTVGLKADGTVVAVGSNVYGKCDVSDWTDIVAISAGYGHTIGLKADGTVVAVGYNDGINAYTDGGQCNVSGWTGIKVTKK